MVTNKKVYLTKQGLRELKKEYKELIEVKRPQFVVRISHAREMGDLAENSDYQDARDKLRFLDDRIAELQKVLSKAVVVEKEKNPQKIGLGCRVSVRTNGKKQVFILVSELEADPTSQKISYQSPLGRAFMGKKVGEKVEVATPSGKAVYKVEKIE